MLRTRALAKGHIRIDTRDANTGVLLHTQEFDNLLTANGGSLIRDALAGASGAYLKYIAYGEGATEALVTDAMLGAEVARDTFSALDVNDPGKLTCEHYLDTNAANGYTLSEMALFGGANCGATQDSGEMYSRALLTDVIAKTEDIALTVWWTLTWEGGQ